MTTSEKPQQPAGLRYKIEYVPEKDAENFVFVADKDETEKERC